VKGGLRRALGAWGEAARRVGFFLGLLAGSAALGLLIAWPLWFLATSWRKTYTIAVLALAAAGLAAALIRALIRRGRARRDPGHPLKLALSTALAVLIVLAALGGAYTLVVLFFRGIWFFAIPGALLWAGLLWLLARARGALNPRRQRHILAENGSE